MTKSDELTTSICGDNGCIFGKARGMATNGGCRCLKDMRDTLKRIKIERRIRALRQALKEAQE